MAPDAKKCVFSYLSFIYYKIFFFKSIYLLIDTVEVRPLKRYIIIIPANPEISKCLLIKNLLSESWEGAEIK